MKRLLLFTFLSFAWCCISFPSYAAVDPDLERVMSQVFLLLSKNHTVFGRNPERPVLWVNAKTEKTPRPDSKSPDAAIRWSDEVIPKDSGIVLHLHPPFKLRSVQKNWHTHHDLETRCFEVIVPLAGGQVIGIHGSYGPDFPKADVEQIMALALKHTQAN